MPSLFNYLNERNGCSVIKVVVDEARCDLCPPPSRLPCRDNAWPLQPRSGPDHPCLCLPGSDGRPVLLCGPAHQGQEQTQAQETAHQTAHIPPTAADDDGEKPHRLIRTATFSCCWMESWVSLQNCSKRTTCVENQRVWRFGISWCLMDSLRRTRDFNSNLPDFKGIQVSVGCWNSFRASCLFKAVRGCLCVRGLMNSIRQCYAHDVKCTLHIWHLTEKNACFRQTCQHFALSSLTKQFLYEWNVSDFYIYWICLYPKAPFSTRLKIPTEDLLKLC